MERRENQENIYIVNEHKHGNHYHFNIGKGSCEHSHKNEIGSNEEGCPCCAAAIKTRLR